MMAEAGGRIDGIALASIGAGAVFLYAGIRGKSILAALQAIVQGKSPSTAAQSAPIAQTSGDETGASTGATISGVNIPASVAAGSAGNSVAANKILGQFMAAGYGWIGTQWDYLESGWQEESGWSTTAANNPSDPYNGAYGIPQANPGTKMASAGADWKTSAETQIAWGLAYIKATYGSPDQVPLWSASGPLPGYEGY
jgi:hypothetical protein